MVNSPFKFLDSFTLTDREIFFGRDQEITELYRRVFESKMLLVYGVSGTGKSSLINCGLASRFDDSDWLPVNVRRGSNIIESVNEAFNKQAIRPLKKNKTISEKLQSIYLDHFKPVYLILDQFEELFIFGSQDEKTGFIKFIKEIIESETQCHVLFIIREEFLAGITEFESALPEIFSNRFRVEKMKRVNAIQAIEGPCRIYNIETEAGFSEKLIDKLCSAGNEIELTFLQIYLDRIYRIAISEKQDEGELKFSKELLDKAGSVSDLLGQFLEEQIRELDEPEKGMSILKTFVSVQGTKRQMNEKEIYSSVETFGTEISEPELLRYLVKFVDLRILRERDEAGNFELRHDSLAGKIYDEFTAIEKDVIEVKQFIENSFLVFEKRGKLLSAEDLKYIAPYKDRLYTGRSEEAFIQRSINELTRAKRRRRNIAISASLILLIGLLGFTFWAIKERYKSDRNYISARANSYNYLSQKIVETDPTVAIRLAEYAFSLDSLNPEIVQNLNRIYYDNSFYKIIARHKDRVQSIAVSPDGKNILSGSSDSTACLWDMKGNLQHVYRGHKDIIRSVAFSPDGKTILTGSNDNSARLWSLNGDLLQVFKGHENSITSVAFSPDGKSIVTGSEDNTARRWDLRGNLLQLFKGHEKAIWAVTFSPDGMNILTGSWDKTARLWDLKGNLLQVLTGHKDFVLAVCFSPDGKNILTGSFDNTAFLWDLKGNKLLELIGHKGGVTSVAFSKDGKSMLTGSWDKTARLWDLYGNLLQEVRGHDEVITSLAFSSNYRSILTGSYDKTVRQWDIKGGILQKFVGHTENVKSVCFSPDGKSILTGSYDKTARLWDLNGNVIQVFRGHTGGIISVAFSPDGNKILTGSEDSTIRLWDLHGRLIQLFTGHKDGIEALAFSPDNKSILSGSSDGTVILWDFHGNIVRQSEKDTDGISSVSFSPDSKRILIGSAVNKIKLFDLQGKELQVFKMYQEEITSVSFSPDGESILTSSYNKTARLWSLSGKLIRIFKGQEDFIYSASFSPDGKTIVTGSQNSNATVWDLNGNIRQIFRGHSGFINSVVFSPDGKSILTGSWDRTACLWDIKETLREFQRENSYEKLSISNQLKFAVLSYADLTSSNDTSLLTGGAKYYYLEAVESPDTEKGLTCIKNAIGLYKKILRSDENLKYSIALDDAYKVKKTMEGQ